jgi:hypothetical protein
MMPITPSPGMIMTEFNAAAMFKHIALFYFPGFLETGQVFTPVKAYMPHQPISPVANGRMPASPHQFFAMKPHSMITIPNAILKIRSAVPTFCFIAHLRMPISFRKCQVAHRNQIADRDQDDHNAQPRGLFACLRYFHPYYDPENNVDKRDEHEDRPPSRFSGDPAGKDHISYRHPGKPRFFFLACLFCYPLQTKRAKDIQSDHQYDHEHTCLLWLHHYAIPSAGTASFIMNGS